MKALVVDDSKFARATLTKMIRERDPAIEVFQGTNGQEGVELFEKERPDITFLDLTMPVMSGFEALEAIMQIDAEAVVIVVTADIQPLAKKRVKEAGAKVMVSKPIREGTLGALFDDFTSGQ